MDSKRSTIFYEEVMTLIKRDFISYEIVPTQNGLSPERLREFERIIEEISRKDGMQGDIQQTPNDNRYRSKIMLNSDQKENESQFSNQKSNNPRNPNYS